MIVLSHLYLFSDWGNDLTPLNSLRLLFWDSFGPVGAVTFFIITGYFINDKRNIDESLYKSKKKIQSIWLKTICYSWIISFVLTMFGNSLSLSKANLQTFFPIVLNEYWFITAYILLVASSPFLDHLILSLNQKQLYVLNALLIGMQILETFMNPTVSRLVLAISCYIIGASIRLNLSTMMKIRTWLLMLVIILVMLFDAVSILGCRFIGISFKRSAHFTQYIPACIIAVAMLILILKLPKFNKKIINILALGSFAVYLITEQALFRPILWNKIVRITEYKSSPYLYLISFVYVALIYLFCALVDIFITFISYKLRKIRK